FSSRRRHTRCLSDWSSDVCSSDLSFSYQPLRWVTYFGFLVSLVAFLLIPTYMILALVFPERVGRGFFTIILMILFLGGVQLISKIGRASCRERVWLEGCEV